MSVVGARITVVSVEPDRLSGAQTSSASARPAERPAAARWWRLLGVLVLALSALPLTWHYLVSYPHENWQVDLEVYRQGARALVTGVPLYDLRTSQPQFLPFTYPPFAAFTALPLLLASFHVIGWVWTVLQFALLWYIVGRAFRPMIDRFGARAGLAQGVIAGGCVWMLPVSDGIRFGQVNAVIVALCVWDVAHRPQVIEVSTGRLTRAWLGGNGIGVALAAAVKLTPGVFWLHWAVSRRWRVLATSIVTVALVTIGSALLLPPASTTYWTDALLDPSRLGPNAGTSNQSLRGVLLRLGPNPGPLFTLSWGLCVVVVLVGGLALARRFDRLGEPIAVVATVGMVAYLISPVSWVHHMHWGVVVIGALLGDGRDLRRAAAALAAAVLLWIRLPWWGANLLADPHASHVVARIIQNSYSWWAVLSLLGLWLLVARNGTPEPKPARDAVLLDTGSVVS
jgi:alpha-1,2-mannosyltransferase